MMAFVTMDEDNIKQLVNYAQIIIITFDIYFSIMLSYVA